MLLRGVNGNVCKVVCLLKACVFNVGVLVFYIEGKSRGFIWTDGYGLGCGCNVDREEVAAVVWWY